MNRPLFFRMQCLTALMALLMVTLGLSAQSVGAEPVIRPDTLSGNVPDAVMEQQTDSLVQNTLDALSATADSLTLLDAAAIAAVVDSVAAEAWTPDPSRATWMALIFPGGGQIYNRKYWKLPIVYGGFLGCAYALTWNNQMYSDYSQAYLDIMDDDPLTASYEDFLPPRYNVAANEAYLKKVFKNRKDRYRRYRDLSIFSFIGVYALSVIDAYVDAELSHFDISEDLVLDIRPSLIEHSNMLSSASIGLQCSFSF